MNAMRRRRPAPTVDPIATGAPTRDEVKRLAKLARSYLPKSDPRRNRRRLSDRAAVIEIGILVGAAAGKVMGVWSEPSIRAIALVLADATKTEELRRAVGIWRSVEIVGASERKKIRAEVVRGHRLHSTDRG